MVLCLKRKLSLPRRVLLYSSIDWLHDQLQLEMLPFRLRGPPFQQGGVRLKPQGSTGLSLIPVHKRAPGLPIRGAGRRLTRPEKCQALGCWWVISQRVTTFLHPSVSPGATDRLPKPTALPWETRNSSLRAAQPLIPCRDMFPSHPVHCSDDDLDQCPPCLYFRQSIVTCNACESQRVPTSQEEYCSVLADCD